MLKRSITYTDYNGGTRTEDFYFNLTQAIFSALGNFSFQFLEEAEPSVKRAPLWDVL